MIRIFGTVFAGLMGLAFGSFLNVCLTRWPAGESIATPRSHCRSCERTLAWWENIPVLSWIALRGRCSTCGVGIGWRYPFIELAVGALWAIVGWRFFRQFEVLNTTPQFGFLTARYEVLAALATMAFLWIQIAIAALDAERFWIPDLLTIPGIAMGLILEPIALPSLHASLSADPGFWILLEQRALAAALAAFLILLIRWLYWVARRREGIGLGDAKLMAMLGAWLGLPGALLAFAIGVVIGAVVGLAALARPKLLGANNASGMTQLPLGTFLCIGGIVSALWGQPIIVVYLRWAGFN